MASLLPTPEPPDPVEGALGHFDHTNWVKASLKALDQGTVHKGGDSIPGTTVADRLAVNDEGSVNAFLDLIGTGNRGIWGWKDGNPKLPRWLMLLGDITAETGNNSGSRFGLYSYKDDGNVNKTVLDGDRNTGLLTVAADPTAALGIATKQYVDSALPLGAIIAYGGGLPLTGRMALEWHPCDGTAHNSGALTAVLGGSLTTPDLAGLFVVGAGLNKDSTTGAVTNYPIGKGAKAGREAVTLTHQQSGLPAHNHVVTVDAGNAAHAHYYHKVRPNANSGSGADWHYIIDEGREDTSAAATAVDNAYHGHTASSYNNTAKDATTAHENRPPYYALVYIIKKV